MEEIKVEIISIDFVKNNIGMILSCASKERLEKANKLNDKDYYRSIGAAYLLKKYLGDKCIGFNPNGKPYSIDGPYFNISHSGNYIALAISEDRDIGIDVERIDKRKVKTIQYILKNNEKTEDLQQLFQIWSNKESLLKCLGSNIGDIKDIPDLPLNGVREFKGKTFYSVSNIYQGYSLSVTLEGNEPFEVQII